MRKIKFHYGTNNGQSDFVEIVTFSDQATDVEIQQNYDEWFANQISTDWYDVGDSDDEENFD